MTVLPTPAPPNKPINPLIRNCTVRVFHALERAETARLAIYSLGGQRVAQLVDAFQRPGYHQTIWDGRDRHGRPLASGVYLARLQAGSFTETRKLLLIR